MAAFSDTIVEPCGCTPFPGSAEGESCRSCSPNMAVTCQELAILGRMREIKGHVRDIAARLKEIQQALGNSVSEDDSYQPTQEWERLTCELDGLRSQWREWEQGLQDAIEAKLIALGHREPRT